MAEQEEGEEDGSELRYYKVTVPRFALILLLDPFRKGKLKLPEDFAEEHGSELANEVLLNLPNGAEWPVSVVKSGRKKIWFDNGWTKFAKFYSLEPTHFMVFQLADRSHFNVMIFDTSATEINYSKKKCIANVEPETNEAVERHPPSSSKAQGTASGMKADRNRSSNLRRPKPLTADKEASGILGKANAVFESENPSFTVVMQQTHLIHGNRLNVPVDFWETNFVENRGDIFLQLTNVGVWKGEYLVMDYGYTKRAYLEAKSWGSFARANYLRVGDKCAFELVEDGNAARFNVVIFRTSPCRVGKEPTTVIPATESHLTSPRPIKLRRRIGVGRTARASKGQNQSSAPRRAKKAGFLARAKAVFESDNRYFMVNMKPSYIGPGTRLYVPAKFVETNFVNQCGDIVLQVPGVGGEWTVKYLVRGSGNLKRAVLQTESWTSFAEDTGLKVGDVCAFELVEFDTMPRLNVVIFRASRDANRCHRSGTGPTTKATTSKKSGCTRKSERHEPSHGNTGKEREISSSAALEAANAFTSNEPSFKTVVTYPHLTRGRPYIPEEFLKYMKEGSRKMKLYVASKSWEVTICRYKDKMRAKSRVFMNGGWRKFARGNKLVAGNVCVFELIEGEEEDDATVSAVVSVRIFRG